MKKIAIVEGIRTPFIKAWTLFDSIPSQILAKIATDELLQKTNFNPNLIDEVIFGTVAQPAEASNIARVISLYSNIPQSKKAYTISRNCASGFESVTSAVEKIGSGVDNIILAGGTESMSNMPFMLKKQLTNKLMKLNKSKTILSKLKILSSIKAKYLNPVIGLELGLTDTVCGLNMGQTAEVLAKELAISRKEQDEFALMSHKKAIKAKDKLSEEIVPVIVPPKYKTTVEHDNGPRQDQTIEALNKLKPYFDKSNGTVTVGNACQVTDGACAVLIMEEEKAKALGYEPLGYIKAYEYVGLEPRKMGLGPAYAIGKVLQKTGINLGDIELFEINEAFAVQVLACLKLLESRKFAKDNFGQEDQIGKIDIDKLNVNGGAIALGHPVGATGTRMIITMLKEMKRRGLGLGMVSLCIGGGQGGAIIIER